MRVLGQSLKDAVLLRLNLAVPAHLPFTFWALFVAAVSIFEGCREEWLRVTLVQMMDRLGVRTWVDTRIVLRRFLWTDVLHSVEGKQLFEECLRQPPAVVDLEDA